MTRIKGNQVQIGSSFVLPIENQHQEELTAIEKMLMKAKADKEKIISEGTEQAKQLVDEAKQILVQAQEDAKKIIEQANNQANSEADAIRETAKKEGFDEGYKNGYNDGTKSLEEKVAAVEIFTKSQFDLKKNIIKSAELDIIELVNAIARKVCKKSFDSDINILKAITEDAIKQLKDKENITITINPNLAEKLYSISEELKEKIPQLESIKILEDSNVSEDGTIVESLLSRVDNRLKIQIDQIVEKFFTAHFSTEEKKDNEKENNDEITSIAETSENKIEEDIVFEDIANDEIVGINTEVIHEE